MISVSVVRVPLSTAQPLIIMDSPVSSRVIDCSSNIESVYAYSIESIEVYKKYMKFSNSNFKNTKKKTLGITLLAMWLHLTSLNTVY